MIRLSIQRKIMGIAVALVVLMAVTAVLSMVSVMQVGGRLNELAEDYVPAYADLARMDIRSLERAILLRRMIIKKSDPLAESDEFAALRKAFDVKGDAVDQEGHAALNLIHDLVEGGSSFGDAAALARIESRIEALMNDTRRELNAEQVRLLAHLDSGNTGAMNDDLVRIEALRGELNQKLEAVRASMLALLQADAAIMLRKQRNAMLIAAALTLLAAILGLVFAMLVSAGMTRPVRRLLAGTRAVEAGNLDGTLVATTQDEIGQLTAAFNRMVEQLRLKERIRETFGKYIDPRIVEGLIDKPVLAAEGQRRVMTVLFCDVRGFTSASEGMTPQGLVKVMNRYFSVMSAPIHDHEGVIDKYIGDSIMAYWGAPFVQDKDQARLAGLAALEMLDRVGPLRAEFPELLGVRSLPVEFDVRIGIATGEALVGSIGSDLMMSYTVMGETVNLASRLEGANKFYGGHILVSEATVVGAADAIEAREIDRVALLGQARPQAVFEIMARKGQLTPAQIELRARFAEGLAAYRARRWDDARLAFAAALDAAPGDGPSKSFIERLEGFKTSPPDDNWDGSWHLDKK
jgi:adenylate cyclase